MNIQRIGLFVAVCGGIAAFASHASAETYLCESGNGMRADEMVEEFIILAKTAGSTPAAAGECATKGNGEPLFQGGELNLHIGLDVGGAQNLVSAIASKGTTFSVQGTKTIMGQMTVIKVSSIGDVVVAGGGGGGGGNDDDMDDPDGDNAGDAGNDQPADEGEGGGNDQAMPSDECPAGVATVDVSDTGFEVLNVREQPSKKSPVVGQVPDGSEVTILGACTQPGAGFKAGKVGAAAKGWCRVEEPDGCAMSQFLNFEGGAGDNGAGIAKKRKNKG